MKTPDILTRVALAVGVLTPLAFGISRASAAEPGEKPRNPRQPVTQPLPPSFFPPSPFANREGLFAPVPLQERYGPVPAGVRRETLYNGSSVVIPGGEVFAAQFNGAVFQGPDARLFNTSLSLIPHPDAELARKGEKDSVFGYHLHRISGGRMAMAVTRTGSNKVEEYTSNGGIDWQPSGRTFESTADYAKAEKLNP